MTCLEILAAEIVHRGDDERPVKKVVLLLACCLGNEQAAMASRTVQESVLVHAFWFVLGTNRIVGTQLAEFERVTDVFVDSSAYLNQPAERAFRV